MGVPNIITTDMGGTSFDVGIIAGGQPAYSFISNVIQYDYFLPKVDIQAIGSGGGSLARVTGSAGRSASVPTAPARTRARRATARATAPTVTDADVVLGYLDPDNFLGGRMKLDKAKAVAAVQSVADQLGLSLAGGGERDRQDRRVQDGRHHPQDDRREGPDPRDFVLFAFGGAGPVHAAVFGASSACGSDRAATEIASTWCAFGAASADILHVYEQVDIQGAPFDAGRVNRVLAALQARAEAQMAKDGIAASRGSFQFSLDMRHRGQINEVEVMLPEGRLAGDFAAPLRSVSTTVTSSSTAAGPPTAARGSKS